MTQKKQSIILIGVIWGLVVVIGIVLLVVIKKRNSSQVLGATVTDTPTAAPSDLPTDTPSDYTIVEPTGTPFVFDPTPHPSDIPLPTPTPIPSPTPTPTPTPQTYQATISVTPSGSLPSDGTSAFTILVHVTDQNNNSIGGATVGLSSDSNLMITPSDTSNTPTDSSGNATFKVTSTMAKTYALSVLVYHIAVPTNGNTSITFSSTSTPSPTPQ